jgi:hypothetical protein
LLVAITGSLSVRTTLACDLPTIRVARNFSSVDGGTGSLHVSIDERDMSVERLSCLGRHIRQENASWRDGTVLVFTNFSQARDFVSLQNQRMDATLRAMFTYEEREDRLTVLPMGLSSRGGEDFSSSFTLEDASPRKLCRLRLNERCVMQIPRPVYPAPVLEVRGGGDVVVRATVRPDGHMKSVKVARVLAAEPAWAQRLAQRVVADVARWRVEPSTRSDVVEIAFTFLTSDGAAQSEAHHLQEGGTVWFELVNSSHIVIHGLPEHK